MTKSNNTFRLAACDEPLFNPELEKKVDRLYEKLTPGERVAQLHGMFLHDVQGEDGHIDPEKCRQLIPNGVGHVCQYASNASPETTPEEIRDLVAELQDWLIHNTPSGIPALFHEEVISGVASPGATTYPEQIGIACSFNPELVEAKTRYTARNMRDIGGFLALSPMVDVSRNPSFNRDEESYGEDSYLTAVLGAAFVRGLQDGGLNKGIAACSKHFLGYGCVNGASDKEIVEEILLPHEAIIRTAGSKVVMTGYHDYHGTRCVVNHELANGLLRKYLGYDGLMVSDYGSVTQFPIAEVDNEPAFRAAEALKAGNDVEFSDGANYSHLQEAMEAGYVDQKYIETSVKRVLALKERVGLFASDARFYKEGHIEFDTPEERSAAYELATQSVVLLKNDGILPLKGSGLKLMLTGPNANQMWAMLGDYTYHGMAYFWHHFLPGSETPKISLLKPAMEGKLPQGWSLDYERGCDWTEKVETIIEKAGDARASESLALNRLRRVDSGEKSDWDAAIAKASCSDVIIAAMGENIMLCGENRDRGSLRLPGRQAEFVEALIATGKPVVLVIFGGRAQVIADLADRCAAVIQAWYPGEEGGNAVADILYGNVSPSAKLSVSYPNVEIYENICYNSSLKMDPRVQYPFGYGLSYSSFDYSDLAVNGVAACKDGACCPLAQAGTDDEKISISFNVTNTGAVKADEIAQIYLSPTNESQPMKPIQLHGFGRISLQPGESGTLSFIMSPQQFGHYTEAGWEILSGVYEVKIGASSQDIRLSQRVELAGNPVLMPLRTVYFTEAQD